MKCYFCNQEMSKDDIDKHSKLSKDIYYICYHCNGSCIEEIRPNKPKTQYWHRETGNKSFDKKIIIKEKGQ